MFSSLFSSLRSKAEIWTSAGRKKRELNLLSGWSDAGGLMQGDRQLSLYMYTCTHFDAYFSERTHFRHSKYYVYSPDICSLGTHLLLLPYWVINSGLSELLPWNSDFVGHFSWWIRLGTQTSNWCTIIITLAHTKGAQLYDKPAELRHGILNNYSKWLNVCWGKTFFFSVILFLFTVYLFACP